jgi:CBS domain containing-hemolysin-like protein
VVGLLDREAMLAGLRDHGPQSLVGDIMRASEPLRSDMPLVEAMTALQARRVKAEAVTDAAGRVTGVLTMENVAEMMMVESAQPGWRFARRG